MPQVKIRAVERVRYERIIELTEDELIDLELTAHECLPCPEDLHFRSCHGDSLGCEDIEIEIVKPKRKSKKK